MPYSSLNVKCPLDREIETKVLFSKDRKWYMALNFVFLDPDGHIITFLVYIST